MDKKFRILDLFCGAGGFSYGIDKNKNFKTLIGVDFNPDAIKTFTKNIKSSIGMMGDISNPDFKNDVINKSKQLNINMIIGGPPCQGFSLKGKRLGLKDPRNFLFLDYFKIVEELRPELFIIENVKNILRTNDGYFINEIKSKFESLGYFISFGFVNAKNFSIPQNRERALIIGCASKKINLPKGTDKIVNVFDAISDLSYLDSGEGVDESNYLNPSKTEYQKLLRGKKLFNHKSTRHSEMAISKLKMIPPEGDKNSIPLELRGKQKFATTWSRLRWDQVSPTIDTRFDTPSNGRNSHPFLNRAITPREAARIQSFDDDFIFFGSKTSICRQIGNAVPPLLGKAIADSIEESYKEKNINSEEAKIYLGDSYKIIDKFRDDKVFFDHIITDPPYNISKENNLNTLKNRKGVYFGDWDKNFDLLSWLDLYLPLLNKNGSVIVFCSYLNISYFVKKFKDNNMICKDVIVWKKTNPMPRNVNRRYVQDMEFALWAVKENQKWIFNKDKEKPYLRSLFESGNVQGKERTSHPTQKSLKLMEWIIKNHTKKGQVILDPFMGSGSTGVAALRTGRKFIGIEKDRNYFEISKKRLCGEKKNG